MELNKFCHFVSMQVLHFQMSYHKIARQRVLSSVPTMMLMHVTKGGPSNCWWKIDDPFKSIVHVHTSDTYVCSFLWLFPLSTITAASGCVLSSSPGAWQWLKGSDPNRDVIAFRSGVWVNWWGLVCDSLGWVPSMRSPAPWILLSLSSRQSKSFLSRTHST